jgi:succinoglycan biosynthesis protein ExoV
MVRFGERPVGSMRLYQIDGVSRANFGDHLNSCLWEELLPGCWSTDPNDALFCGIGTIIGRQTLPPASRYVVFGSGTGYDGPPADFGSAKWDVHCVRGPLTARVLGLPDTKAVADAALLVRLLSRYSPLPEEQRHGIVFMPHFEAFDAGNWKLAAERAGVELLDPLVDSRKTIESIRGARLVLADAMHAAIVADVLRVPWIPMTTSKQINMFKWLDWTLSVGAPYEPVQLPASSLIEAIRNATLSWYGGNYALAKPTFEMAIESYEMARTKRQKSWWASYGKWARRVSYSVPKKLAGLPGASAATGRVDERYLEGATETLRRTTLISPYLSDEKLLNRRIDQLSSLLSKVAV